MNFPRSLSPLGLLPDLLLAGSLLILLVAGVVGERFLGRLLASDLVFAQLLLVVFLLLPMAATVVPTIEVDCLARLLRPLLLGVVVFYLLLLRGVSIPLPSFEFLLLVAFALLGQLLLLASGDFLVAYLALELTALAIYPLAASRRFSLRSTEAGLKYFLLGSFSSALLLLGVALSYGVAGTVRFGQLAAVVVGLGPASTEAGPLALALGLVVAALLLKGAVAPFHFWAPDVYDGAPFVVVAFLAAAAKVAVFGFLARLLYFVFFPLLPLVKPWLLALGILSLVVGTLGAILQSSVRRFVAYSGVVHGGYLLLPLATGNRWGLGAFLVYLTIYVFLIFGLLGSMAVLRSRRHSPPLVRLEELVVAARSDPFGAGQLVLALFSLAGLPPLAGFFAKVQVVVALLAGGHGLVALVVLVTSVASAFYYLRLVRLIYFDRFFVWAFLPPPSPPLVLLLLLATVANLAFAPLATVLLPPLFFLLP